MVKAQANGKYTNLQIKALVLRRLMCIIISIDYSMEMKSYEKLNTLKYLQNWGSSIYQNTFSTTQVSKTD